jgi:hypothetical protein
VVLTVRKEGAVTCRLDCGLTFSLWRDGTWYPTGLNSKAEGAADEWI